jgi:PAS domain S-box-containing protein
MGSWVFDPAGFFSYWSRELFQIYDLDPTTKAPSLKRYLACVHPQDREFTASLIERVVRDADAAGCDVTQRIVRPDGEIRHVRCVGAPVVENGKLKSIVGTTIDVTDHKLLTQELRRREAYLAEAQRLSHTGSFGWRPDTGAILWSDETYRIFEYDRSVIPTMDLIIQRVHPEDRADFQEVINQASVTGTDFEHTYRLLMPDGRVKHFHALAHAAQDESGNREFLGAGTDITERKNVEEKVREREEELRQMLDLTPQLAAVYGARGERLRANRILLDYLGLSNEEWLQRSDRDVDIHPDDRERANDIFDRALSSGSAFETEMRLRKGDGSYRWLLTRYNPLRDDKGQITRWYAAGTDIEERKQAEERLRHENIALQEEISKASMFEEIVGDSPALRTVLDRARHRRDRNGQRTHRSGNSPPLATLFASLCQCELCCHSPRFDRLGIVRP